jgi:hypothetical protein
VRFHPMLSFFFSWFNLINIQENFASYNPWKCRGMVPWSLQQSGGYTA